MVNSIPMMLIANFEILPPNKNSGLILKLQSDGISNLDFHPVNLFYKDKLFIKRNRHLFY